MYLQNLGLLRCGTLYINQTQHPMSGIRLVYLCIPNPIYTCSCIQKLLFQPSRSSCYDHHNSSLTFVMNVSELKYIYTGMRAAIHCTGSCGGMESWMQRYGLSLLLINVYRCRFNFFPSTFLRTSELPSRYSRISMIVLQDGIKKVLYDL